jgi:hypothetical protein
MTLSTTRRTYYPIECLWYLLYIRKPVVKLESYNLYCCTVPHDLVYLYLNGIIAFIRR